jgi:hypothetical protein
VNKFQGVFDAQKTRFATGVKLSYEWRSDQLDRMGCMISENEKRFQHATIDDFKTARPEYVLETMAELAEVERANWLGKWTRYDRSRTGSAP